MRYSNHETIVAATSPAHEEEDEGDDAEDDDDDRQPREHCRSSERIRYDHHLIKCNDDEKR